MQTTMNTNKSKLNGKLNGKLKSTFGAIQNIVDAQPKMKENFKAMLKTEGQLVESGVKQVSSLSKYVKANWKTIVPTLAAIGVGAYFLKGRSVQKLTKKLGK